MTKLALFEGWKMRGELRTRGEGRMREGRRKRQIGESGRGGRTKSGRKWSERRKKREIAGYETYYIAMYHWCHQQ